MEISQGKDILPGYNNHYTIREMVESLQNSSYKLCDFLNEKKKSRNNELKENIIHYLEENYTDSSLTMAAVSHKMRISEKYLCNFIKEQTGETFAVYLERIRIQHAKEYLITTNWSNEKVAEQTGFAAVNTFYRAFSKQTGVSPGIYRSSYQQYQKETINRNELQ
ncbi:helix-turn-helix domain-containing protein [Anaerocolumna sedimenticola]|uniref:Helix-turn-helix domain-containing protein n=1 Tax=Anaerocolumna sedimenticola TaxID=2696063 RepID=A0A6P1TID3_9FIRM|nr:AraC family transcriptional regulator [Anaerocolumna sedimenticola]QHQ60894.1 helix-turn-helix domain-containing protein [Anaerocolumna sedimenticola]